MREITVTDVVWFVVAIFIGVMMLIAGRSPNARPHSHDGHWHVHAGVN